METGPGRGAALLVGLMGVAMALLAVRVRLRRDQLAPSGPREESRSTNSPTK